MIKLKFLFISILFSLLGVSCKPAKSPAPELVTIWVSVAPNANRLLQDSCITVLKKRVASYDSTAIVKVENSAIKISIPTGSDTAAYKELVTAPGVLTIYEAYAGTNMLSHFDKLNKLIKTQKLGKKLSTDSTDYAFLDTEERPSRRLFYGSQHDSKQHSPSSLIAYTKVQDTAFVNRLFKQESVRALFPPDMLLFKGQISADGLYPYHAFKQPAGYTHISNSMLSKVKATPSSYNDSYEIDVLLEKRYASLWSEMTKRNIGQTLPIVIDERLMSEPLVHAQIEGGRFIISGRLQKRETTVLAAILNGGVMPQGILIF